MTGEVATLGDFGARAALYIACRCNTVVQMARIAEVARCSEARLWTTYKAFQRELSLPIPRQKPTDWVPRILSNVPRAVPPALRQRARLPCWRGYSSRAGRHQCRRRTGRGGRRRSRSGRRRWRRPTSLVALREQRENPAMWCPWVVCVPGVPEQCHRWQGWGTRLGS
jgi:hypothetical protein